MQIDFIYNPVFTQTEACQYSDSSTAFVVISAPAFLDTWRRYRECAVYFDLSRIFKTNGQRVLNNRVIGLERVARN